MGIGSDRGRAGGEQSLHMPANEGAAVAAADKLRIADRLVDPPSAGRQVREMVPGPGVGIVILRISEGSAVHLDDPGACMRIGHRFLEEAPILVRRPPIFHPVRPPAPVAQEGQIGCGDGPETIIIVHRRGLAPTAAAGEAEGPA